MLAPHRRTHRLAWIVFALVVPALFVLALWQRPRATGIEPVRLSVLVTEASR